MSRASNLSRFAYYNISITCTQPNQMICLCVFCSGGGTDKGNALRGLGALRVWSGVRTGTMSVPAKRQDLHSCLLSSVLPAETQILRRSVHREELAVRRKSCGDKYVLRHEGGIYNT